MAPQQTAQARLKYLEILGATLKLAATTLALLKLTTHFGVGVTTTRGDWVMVQMSIDSPRNK